MPLERDDYLPLRKGARIEGHLLYRIPDAKDTGLKPFDFMGIHADGKPMAVEAKRFTGKGICNPLDLLAHHQYNWLHEFAKRGAWSLIPVNHLRSKEMMLWQMDRHGEIFRIPNLLKIDDLWRNWPD